MQLKVIIKSALNPCISFLNVNERSKMASLMKRHSKLQSHKKWFDPNPHQNIKSNRLGSSETVPAYQEARAKKIITFILLHQTGRTRRMRKSFACMAVKNYLTRTRSQTFYSYMVIYVLTLRFANDIKIKSPRSQSVLFVELPLQCLEVVGKWGPLYQLHQIQQYQYPVGSSSSVIYCHWNAGWFHTGYQHC